MDCGHNRYRSVESSYDQRRGVLVYFWRCEQCGARLGEAGRVTYRPQFDPRGHEKFFKAVR